MESPKSNIYIYIYIYIYIKDYILQFIQVPNQVQILGKIRYTWRERNL